MTATSNWTKYEELGADENVAKSERFRQQTCHRLRISLSSTMDVV
jgi:hypothetical protein